MVRWLYLSGLVLAALVPPGLQELPEPLDGASSWKSLGSRSIQSFPSSAKRHSEGTFSSDFTRYLDRMKAKDFVHWLINTKRCREKGRGRGKKTGNRPGKRSGKGSPTTQIPVQEETEENPEKRKSREILETFPGFPEQTIPP
ncbi:exendin-3-like [Myiozetetes cayanensis]|uniref:exendin-3-like n=1 Tax=Myiozetetes cayanensis TaxID=478635 RepID=UPI00215EE938|nr:exendin-3-like [Myiozetetes cayanensis]